MICCFKKKLIFCTVFFLTAVFLFNYGQKISAKPCPNQCDRQHYSFSLSDSNPNKNPESYPEEEKCGKTVYEWILPGGCNGCGDPILSGYYTTSNGENCQVWQMPVTWRNCRTGNDTDWPLKGYICSCQKACLQKQTTPGYYSTPSANSAYKQQEARVTLPALLTWSDPNKRSGIKKSVTASSDNIIFTDLPGYGEGTQENNPTCSSSTPVPVPPSGSQSYLVDFLVNFTDTEDAKKPENKLIRFDPKEPPDPTITKSSTGKEPIPGLGPDSTGKSARPAQILQFVTTKPEFNTRDNGWPCMLNSASKIYWRVRPCCNKDGTGCMPEDNAEWWHFNTSTAPEPIGVYDDKNYKTASPDPDWAGPNALKNVDFCTAGLKWCSAKIEPAKKPYNGTQQINQALSYRLMVAYNEKSKLSALVSDLLNSISGEKNNQMPSQSMLNTLGSISSYIKIPGTITGKKDECHHLLIDPVTKACKPETVSPLGQSQIKPATEFSSSIYRNLNIDLFTKGLSYDWKLKRCFENPNAGMEFCKPEKETDIGYSQTWSFETIDNVKLLPPILVKPNNDKNGATPIGISPTIAWTPQCGANSFEYELYEEETSVVKNRTKSTQITFVKTLPSPTTTSENNQEIKADIKIDTLYKWHVRACWPSEAIPNASQICDNDWSEFFYFRTTGRPPENLKAEGESSANIPANFSWDATPGAGSYLLRLEETQSKKLISKLISPKNTRREAVQLTSDDLNPNKTYSWKVKTCADASGKEENCGKKWAEAKELFTTKTLEAPSGATSPANNASPDDLPGSLSWNPVRGAKAYKIEINYKNSGDTNKDCPKDSKISEGTSPKTSYKMPDLEVACLGTYEWTVASCITESCAKEEIGNPMIRKFFIRKESKNFKSGFLTCGLRDDDTSTKWDERKECQFEDLFKVANKILNFALFKLSFWLLPIMGLITGIIFYTQAGGPQTLKMVIKAWKAIGIGYALIFFAWFLTTWTLQAFGYSGTDLWFKIY